jgi:glutamine synthetase
MAVSFPLTTLNTAVADAMTDVEAEIRKRIDAGANVASAVLEVLHAVAKDTAPIRFEGDNYSHEWHQEAERRGLPNLRRTPEALEWLADPKNHRFFIKHGVFTPEEILARCHVRSERYLKDVDIEYQTLLRMVDTAIFPASAEFLGVLCRSIAETKSAGVDAPQSARAREFGKCVADLESARDAMVEVRAKLDAVHDEREKARRYAGELVPAMQRLRGGADKIETLCGDAFWPLPRYLEMLFVH